MISNMMMVLICASFSVGTSTALGNEIKPLTAYPWWLQQLIDQTEKDSVSNPPMQIVQFLYGNRVVYYIPPKCCDLPSKLFDKAGNLICSPDGGFSGRGDGRCTNFFEARRDGQLIWEDPRSAGRKPD